MAESKKDDTVFNLYTVHRFVDTTTLVAYATF